MQIYNGRDFTLPAQVEHLVTNLAPLHQDSHRASCQYWRVEATMGSEDQHRTPKNHEANLIAEKSCCKTGMQCRDLRNEC